MKNKYVLDPLSAAHALTALVLKEGRHRLLSHAPYQGESLQTRQWYHFWSLKRKIFAGFRVENQQTD